MPSALIFLISLTSMIGLTRCLRTPLTFRFREFRSGHRATWLASATSCSCVRISNFSAIRCRCATMRLSVSPRSAAISLFVFPAANRRKSNLSRGVTYGKVFIPLAVAGRAYAASLSDIVEVCFSAVNVGWQRVLPQVPFGQCARNTTQNLRVRSISLARNSRAKADTANGPNRNQCY